MKKWTMVIGGVCVALFALSGCEKAENDQLNSSTSGIAEETGKQQGSITSSPYTIQEQLDPLNSSQVNYTVSSSTPIGANDLSFWILPDGTYKRGTTVSGTVPPAAEGRKRPRYYRVKKGDWHRVAETIGTPIFIDPSLTTLTHLSSPYPFAGKSAVAASSWNLTWENWAYALLSFTNTTNQTIAQGEVTLETLEEVANVSIDFDAGQSIIPGNWATYAGVTTPTPSAQKHKWTYTNLQPGEVRTVFAYFSLGPRDPNALGANLVVPFYFTHGSDVLTYQVRPGIIPPHDPNSIELLNQDPVAEHVWRSEYPEISGFYPTDSEAPAGYRLETDEQHQLTYRFSYENDGGGVAQDMIVEAPFLRENDLFDLSSLQITAWEGFPASAIQIEHAKDKVRFLFPGIHLQGGDDPYCLTDQPSKGHFEVTVALQKPLKEPVVCNAAITLYQGCTALEAETHFCYPVEPEITNDVILLPVKKQAEPELATR